MSMSYSIKVPEIEIPSPLPADNTKLYCYYHSNISSQGSTTGISSIGTPNDPGSPYNYNVTSPLSYGNTPTSCSSYTLNASFGFSSYNNSFITTPNGSTMNNTDIICNTPNTINNVTHYGQNNPRKSRHKRAHPRSNSNMNTHNKISTLIAQSETPLTPTPNMDITSDIFDFETMEIKENHDVAMTENEEKMDTFQQHLNTKHLNALSETDGNITDNNTDIDVDGDIDPADNEKREQETEEEEEIEDEQDRTNVNEDNQRELSLLQEMGYIKIKKITDTLQGCVFIALNQNNMELNNDKSNNTVVIKRTSKYLHSQGITIQDDKVYKVNENVLKEYDVLKHFTNSPNCPSQITKVIDFFESDNNYYLVMENGGDDFFEFIVKAHQLINERKLNVKEWRKFVKYMFYQMVVVVKWLHTEMNCCHLGKVYL